MLITQQLSHDFVHPPFPAQCICNHGKAGEARQNQQDNRPVWHLEIFLKMAARSPSHTVRDIMGMNRPLVTCLADVDAVRVIPSDATPPNFLRN
jgi:hypothetical protein